ncbi:hypothetical protein [Verrucomicrobium spinosum]|uniref:hypothetical protein n=1 Tax=Verrucomicrobium spinosum TaxID=2736 RepID=UPI00210D56BE|nr:hypothetical protein [Verrucomicrobium spinosum]
MAAHGNDPEARGVEDVLAGMARLYPGGEGKTELKQRLDVLAGDARGRKQEVLAMRLEWASAMSRQREDADSARQQLAAMSSRINPRYKAPASPWTSRTRCGSPAGCPWHPPTTARFESGIPAPSKRTASSWAWG